jgi:hypothetical protein
MPNPSRRRGISPGSRRRQARTAPSRAETPFPITDYFVRPSDPLGRSVNVSVACPPDFKRVAATLLSKELFTFQTEGDIFRWCIKQGLGELAKRGRDEEVTSEANAMAGWLRAAAVQMEHTYYLEILRKISGTVRKLMSEGHRDKAIELADKVWSTVDRIGDEYWRGEYRKKTKAMLDRARKGGTE